MAHVDFRGFAECRPVGLDPEGGGTASPGPAPEIDPRGGAPGRGGDEVSRRGEGQVVRLGATVALVALVACSPGSGAGGDAKSPEGSAPAVSWDRMTFDQRADHMQRVVVPTMRPVLAELDASRFTKLVCTDCHGKDAQRRHFAMPSEDLPALDPTDSFAQVRAEHPEAMRIMSERVVPEMAKALGLEPFDPATGQGIGCFTCHRKAGGD
jgi:hypothetical protein